MVKTIIFDYDGTIHQTLGIYEPAFRETYQWLTEQKVAEEQKIASSRIAGWLGLNSKEMWDTFMPELDQKYKDQASKMVGERMIEQVRGRVVSGSRKDAYDAEKSGILSCSPE